MNTTTNQPLTIQPLATEPLATRRGRTSMMVIAGALTVALASCGYLARHVSEEATKELAGRVRDHVVDHADGRPLQTYVLLADALHDVVDRDAAAEDHDSSFTPSYAGLSDADHDGLDDDGRIEIRVRHASSCLIIDDAQTRIVEGDC